MAEGKTQRELIESEMVRLLGELRQLKGVRDVLDAQTEVKTVRDYLLEGGVAGRIFIIEGYKGGYGPMHGTPYRIVNLYVKESITGNGWAKIQPTDRKTSKTDIPIGYLYDDKEAPLENKVSTPNKSEPSTG